MHNLGTVIRFEVVRTLKKKSFWIVGLSFPLIIAAVFGIIFASNIATENAAEELKNERYSFAITDQSGLLNDDLVAGFDAEEVTDKPGTIQRVQSGDLDAYFYYPENLAEDSIEIYAIDAGLFDNSKYDSVASLLLNQSVNDEVSDNQAAVLGGSINYDSTTYRDGEEYNGFLELLAPGIFLVLFYFLIAFFGNQMLTSTTEEKENRVIEMILTTVEARTLIVGKILSLIALGFVQGVLVILPIIIGYFIIREYSSIVPDLDLAMIPLDWVRIAVGAVVFAVSFMLFTGLLVTIGAAVPTAKEAANFFGIVMILIFGPLYAAPLFFSSPDSTIVQFLSYFPLTAPIPLMLRNAVGNLELWEAGIAMAIMLVTTVFILRISVQVFKYGALEYDRKLSLGEILKPRK